MNPLLDESQEAQAPLMVPFCVLWGTRLPAIDGPYGPGWTAHDACPPTKHGWFIYRDPEDCAK